MTSQPEIPTLLAKLLEAEPLPQRSFPWRREQWKEQMHDLPGVLAVLDQLPERVDRLSTRRIVLSEIQGGRVLSAFVPVMVWGHGMTGVGPIRTRWVLTSVKSQEAVQEPVLRSVSKLLEAGTDAVRSLSPVEAFRIMNNEGRIKHLGPAFFTKWLYFSSALDGPDDQAAAPILDQQVAGWLAEYAEISLDISRTPSYEDYFDLLSAWGERYDRSRVQVEKAIFGLATGRS